MAKRNVENRVYEANVMRLMREAASKTSKKENVSTQNKQEEETVNTETHKKNKHNEQMKVLVKSNDIITDVVNELMEKLRLNGIQCSFEQKTWNRAQEDVMKTLVEMGAV